MFSVLSARCVVLSSRSVDRCDVNDGITLPNTVSCDNAAASYDNAAAAFASPTDVVVGDHAATLQPAVR